jgi:hypothetical protein
VGDNPTWLGCAQRDLVGLHQRTSSLAENRDCRGENNENDPMKSIETYSAGSPSYRLIGCRTFGSGMVTFETYSAAHLLSSCHRVLEREFG